VQSFCRYIFFLFLTLISFNFTFAQTWQTEGFESGAMPPAGWLNVAGTPTNGVAGNWTNVANAGTPVHAPHTGARQAQYNVGFSAANSSRALCSPVINYTGRCGGEQVGFWMYRDNGVAGFVDRLDVWINTAANLGGATLLGSINRRKSLTPVETGADGWYYYSFNIPAAFTGNTNYLLFEANDNFGAGNLMYLDDISWNVAPFGGIASNAGSDAYFCSGTGTTIGSAATAGCTYSWAPTTGLSSSTISNPTINLYNNTGSTTTSQYTVTTTKTGACAGVTTDVISVSVSPGPTTTVAPSNSAICMGNSVALAASATTFPLTSFTNSTGVSILDLATVQSTTTISGMPGTVGTSLSQVGLNLSHTFVGDLNVTLICPSGTQIDLSSGNGGAGDNFTNTVFSTAGPSITTGAAPFTGTFMPEQSFALLSGCPINGTWTLQVQDQVAADVGTINNWSLSFTSGTISTYNWLPATGLSNTTVSNPTATPVVSTIYTVTVTDTKGCANQATSTITVNPNPSNSSSLSATICSGTSVGLPLTGSGGTAPYTFSWTATNNANTTGESLAPSSGSTLNDVITNNTTVNQTVNYTVTVSDANGCSSPLGTTTVTVNPGVSYTSSAAEQLVTTSVSRCSTKQQIISLKMVVSAGCGTTYVSNISFNMNGTSVIPTDVSNIHIYYTGTSATFSPINEFTPGGVPPGAGIITASGSQAITAGTNYFWITYDMDPAGTGAKVDAEWVNVVVSGGANQGAQIPTVTDPGSGRNISTCIAPGGVIPGLTYWLKSNDGTNITGNVHDAGVNTWSSSFSNPNDLTQASGIKRPLFKDYPYDTLFNFNPYLYFDGNDDVLQNTSIAGSGLLADDGLALVVVARSATPDNQTSFAYKEGDSGPFYEIKPENSLRFTNSGSDGGSVNITDFTSPDSDFLMAKMIGIHARTTDPNPDVVEFFRNDDFIPIVGALAPTAEDGLTLGGSGDGGAYERGNAKIGEVITYNKTLDLADLQKVQTYVAVKYGIHLGKDYVSAAGDVIWNTSLNTGYNNDVAGIGRDDASGLNQKQTQSVNTDDLLTIGLSTIENSNKNNTATFTEDNSFLIWGNNDYYAASDYTTLAPTATPFLPPGIEGRLRRVWKLQGTNFGNAAFDFRTQMPPALPTLKVGFDDYLLSNPTPTASIRMLIDDDGVDWSDAAVVGGPIIVGGTTASGSRIMFTTDSIGAVDASGDTLRFITLATTDKLTIPLASEIIKFNAECKSGHVAISWATAGEIDVASFILERSINAINFEAIANMDGKGHVSQTANYYYEDANPQGINYYYRIKQRTTHDTYVYSKIITTQNSCKVDNQEWFDFTVSPNPASINVSEVNLNYASSIETKATVSVISVVGSKIYSTNKQINLGNGVINLPVDKLKSGIYFIQINCGSLTKAVKFIKE